MKTTQGIRVVEEVDCTDAKYTVDCDAQGVSVHEMIDDHRSCVLCSNVKAFHAAAIAEAIAKVTQEYGRQVAKLKGGEA